MSLRSRVYCRKITFFNSKPFRSKAGDGISISLALRDMLHTFLCTQNGQTQINTLCTRRCECQSNVLTCEDNYRCSSHATCEERGGVRQCYCNDGYTGDGETCVSTIPTDCADIYSGGVTDSSVYTIKPTNWPGPSFQVYCNMTDGGGWTVWIFHTYINHLQYLYC